MPPPKAVQGVLRFPLTAILGNEANVRVLRAMFDHGGELSAPAIAERVGLSRQHVHRTLGALADLEVVERVGVGGHPSYRVRESFSLHAILDDLFRTEKQRYQAILRAIMGSVQGKPVGAVWLYGSVARGEDRARSDVDVALVVDGADVDGVADAVREQLRSAEESLGINVSVVPISADDVLRLSAGDPWWDNVVRDAVTLCGPDPERLVSRIRRSDKVDLKATEPR
jgi:predicted nucleotidyltransferase